MIILKNKSLLTLFITQLLSRFGDSIETIAFLFLLMKMTGSTLSMAGFIILNTLPNIIFSPLAGVIGDRKSRKWIMAISEFARFGIIGAVAVLYFASMLQVYHLYIAGFTVSIFESFFTTAKDSSVPNIVSKEDLGKAISFMQVSYAVAQMISLGFAGVIISLFGYGIAFMIDAASFLISAVAIAFLTIPQTKRFEQSSFVKDFVDGFKYVKASAVLIYIVVAGFIVNFFVAPLNLIIPVITKNVFGMDETKAGYIFAALSCGLLFGSIAGYFIDRIDRSFGAKTVFSAMFLILGGGFVFTGAAGTLATILVGFMAIGSSVSLLNVNTGYIFQKSVTDEYRARASSLMTIVMLVTMPIAIGLAGGILERVSVGYLLGVCGAGIMVFAVASYFFFPKGRRCESECAVSQ